MCLARKHHSFLECKESTFEVNGTSKSSYLDRTAIDKPVNQGLTTEMSLWDPA